jgi:hypothetical protein
LAPLLSDEELELDFDLQGDASAPAATPQRSQPSEEEPLLSATGPAAPGDDADSGLDLQLADESPAPIEPAAASLSSTEEAEELTFDLDEPPSLLDTEPAMDASATIASPSQETPAEAAAEIPLQLDDDLELDFELTDSAATMNAVDQSGESVAAPASPGDDDLTFDLAEPEQSLAAEAEPELILDSDEPEFSLQETPPAAAAPKTAEGSSDLELELELAPDRAPEKAPADSASSALPDGNDGAEELSFDVDEPDALEPGPNGTTPKKAAVGKEDADLDSFLKELGL